ncbi:hypothetical protein ACJMK2_022992 [Sinanodonta woodiana]|uniref:non-specific serine/threonine protein kinase n=1 Tax=Sinanodonta woodiana TaxID=1069815 RepID=A0ABD3TM02_SINWO
MAMDDTGTAISTFLKKKNTNEDVSYSLKKTGAVPQIESDYELPHELQRCKQAGGQKHRAGNDMKPGKVLQPRSSDAFPPDEKSEMYKREFPELPQPLYPGAVGETKKEPATITTTERKAQATPATDPKYKTGTEPPDTIAISFGKTYMHETDEVSITNSSMGRLTNTLPLDAKAAVVKTTLPGHIKKPPEPSTSNGPASYPGLSMRLAWTKIIQYSPDSVLRHGSFVYKGSFDNRDVAVKRWSKENTSLAEQEIESLRQADRHPNVIRYYYSEQDKDFIYIASELCVGNLEQYVQGKFGNAIKLEPKELLHQIMKGLYYLHSLGIAHGNIKPDHILISRPIAGVVRILISSFAHSRKLSAGEMSFSAKSDVYRTDRWAAPEMSKTGQNKTSADDIFNVGRLMYYVLTNGKHHFGYHPWQIQYQKEGMLGDLPETSDGYLAKDLILDMMSSNPGVRPTANNVLHHPFFWKAEKTLRFLVAIKGWKCKSASKYKIFVRDLEKDGAKIVKDNWTCRMGKHICEAMQRYVQYDGSRVKDLVRFIRNVDSHYHQLPEDVKTSLGKDKDKVWDFFTALFPMLLDHIYNVMKQFSKEEDFRPYY